MFYGLDKLVAALPESAERAEIEERLCEISALVFELIELEEE